MSPQALLWIKAAHIFGFMMWTGTLIGSCHIQLAHRRAGQDPNQAFSKLERALGISMDIGATLTLVFGILLLVLPPEGMAIFKAGGFFHAKLTLVLGLLAAHVYLRVRHRKFRQGQLSDLPGWLFPVINISILIILVMIIVRPF